MKWDTFIKETKDREPTPWILDAIKMVDKHYPVLDLGCGGGSDALAIAEAGFTVWAVDSSREAIEETERKLAHFPHAVYNEDIAKFSIPENYFSLIVAWNSLPFLSEENFEKVIMNIESGLIKNGIAVLGLFGPEDEWAKHLSTISLDRLKELLPRTEFLKSSNKITNGFFVGGGKKRWHFVRCMAQKI